MLSPCARIQKWKARIACFVHEDRQTYQTLSLLTSKPKVAEGTCATILATCSRTLDSLALMVRRLRKPHQTVQRRTKQTLKGLSHILVLHLPMSLDNLSKPQFSSIKLK